MIGRLTYWRENLDKFEAHYLAPLDWNGDLTAEAPKGLPIAHVRLHYSPARFYRGVGGEGETRPDAFLAFVWDAKADRERSLGRFHSMREAKNAIAIALRDADGRLPVIERTIRTITEAA